MRKGGRYLRREYSGSRGGWVARMYDRSPHDWEVDVLDASGKAKGMIFVPTEEGAQDAVRVLGQVFGCEFRELAARAG